MGNMRKLCCMAGAVVAVSCGRCTGSGNETGVQAVLDRFDMNGDDAIDLEELVHVLGNLTGGDDHLLELCAHGQELAVEDVAQGVFNVSELSGALPATGQNLTELLSNLIPCALALPTGEVTAVVTLGDKATEFHCSVEEGAHDHHHDRRLLGHRRQRQQRSLADDHGHGHGDEEKVELTLTVGETTMFCSEEHHDEHKDDTGVAAETVGLTLAAVLIVTLLSLAGLVGFVGFGWTAASFKWVYELTAFAAGVILSLVLVHLVPEAQELVGGGEDDFWRVPACLVGGIFAGLVNETMMRHHHGLPCDSVKGAKAKLVDEEAGSADGQVPIKQLNKPLIANIIGGDVFCNFIDGVIIAAAFMIDERSGWLVTLSVCLHELPQEYVDFHVLLDAGLTVKNAALANLLGSASSIVGAGLMLGLGSSLSTAAQGFILAFGSGVLLYAALAQLFPRLLDGNADVPLNSKLLRLFLVALGIVVLGLTQLFHYHPGHDDHDH